MSNQRADVNHALYASVRLHTPGHPETWIGGRTPYVAGPVHHLDVSDIEDEGFDAIWVPMTPEEIVSAQAYAKRCNAESAARVAQEKLDGTWREAVPPVYDGLGEEDVPY